MVSKTRKQRAKKKIATAANGGVAPPPAPPSQKKSIHLKKTRPNMKRKMKVRMGLECPIDIYEGFDEQKGVRWVCPTCHATCRVVGNCMACATGTSSTVAEISDSAAIKKALGAALKSKAVTIDASAARKAKLAGNATAGRTVHDTDKDAGKLNVGSSLGGKKTKIKKNI